MSAPLLSTRELAASQASTGKRIPCSTYRLQFSQDFTFRQAADLVPYLFSLGISDLYASPILKARAGSSHGYDVCDPTQLNPVLGSSADFEALVQALQERGMGLLLDTVPNHMGILDGCNSWWLDVLENGPSSPYASFFDIDWHPVKPELDDKVLLPILEDQYGAVLEGGKLHLAFEDGAFFIVYDGLRLPMAPRTYRMVLDRMAAALEEQFAEDDEWWQELQSIRTAINYLPSRTETDPGRLAERFREKEIIKRRLAALYSGATEEVRAAIDAVIQDINGSEADPASYDLLDKVIEAQPYRVASWRVAAEEINYRRFFDINELAAVRVEEMPVFQATHQLTLRLLAEGKVTGLRVDHPDGLWDPPTYFRRLHEEYAAARTAENEDSPEDGTPAAASGDGDRPGEAARLAPAPGSQPGDGRPGPSGAGAGNQAQASAGSASRKGADQPLYIVAEKILSEDEPLPTDWALDGTTGYDFMAAVNDIFVQAGNRKAMGSIYHRFVGQSRSLRDLIISSKLMVMRDSLSSEIQSLSLQIERSAESNRRYRDFTLRGITNAIREIIAYLPIYRTYVNAFTGEISQRDRRFVETSVEEARRSNPRIAGPLFDFMKDTLLLRNLDEFDGEHRINLANWVMKFQQVTAPVMAKGVEDTAYYMFNRLVSLNEVGSNPDEFGISVGEFHRQNLLRQRRWPHSMLATSTHDSKRSEDVRARIDVLSEMPDAWRSALHRWARLNASSRKRIGKERAPDRNDEYLLYQTLLGAWPFAPQGPAGDGAGKEAPLLLLPSSGAEYKRFVERIGNYMIKAAKEAKVHTSWINPNQEYDAALSAFVAGILAATPGNRFLDEFMRLAQRVAYFGQFNSLSQVMLRLTAPGVPDTYQGTELWDLSLVDPDNRRPVDYERRRALLDQLEQQVAVRQAAGKGAGTGEGGLAGLCGELLANCADGRIKLYILSSTLNFRCAHFDLFNDGAYIPLDPAGERSAHVCAYARLQGEEAILVVIPRLVVGLTGGEERPPIGADVWGETRLPLPADLAGPRYRNLFTGEVLLPQDSDGSPGLPLARVLGHFPVALLVAEQR